MYRKCSPEMDEPELGSALYPGRHEDLKDSIAASIKDKEQSRRSTTPRRRSRSPKRHRGDDGNDGLTRQDQHGARAATSKRENSPMTSDRDRHRGGNHKLSEGGSQCATGSKYDKKPSELRKADLEKHRHNSLGGGRGEHWDSDRGRKSSSYSHKTESNSDRNRPRPDGDRKRRSLSSSRDPKRKQRSSSRDRKLPKRRSGSRDRRRSHSRDRGGGGGRKHDHRRRRSHSRDKKKSRSSSRDRNSKGRDLHRGRSRSSSRSSSYGRSKLTSGMPPSATASLVKPALTTEELLMANKAMVEKKIIDLNNEKPSVLPLNDYSIPPLMGGVMTPQLAVQQAMAAMNAKAQQLTGVSLPKYYNPAAVNPMKYAEQMQKRKMLWQKKEAKEVVAPSTNNWETTTFAQDQDGAVAAKFKKLMGIKLEQQAAAEAAAVQSEEQLRKQEELFRTLDQQYEVARISTHSHRGVGLGFPSAAAAAAATVMAAHHSSIAALQPK